MSVQIEKTAWQGWPYCYRISNKEIELIVTSDIGPRVMRCGFIEGANLFKEFSAELGNSGEKEWKPRGGHRLWIAPENLSITYALDNGPVNVNIAEGVLILTQPVEPETGVEKQISLRMSDSSNEVEVVHSLRNTTNFALEFAPWALTMMAQGGVGVTGFPPRGRHPQDLDPTNPLVMWAYTDFSDPRWTFTKKYVALRQDPNNAAAQKLGMFNARTWGAYLLGGDLFIKRCAADPKLAYPDFGSSYEMFTNNDFLELETVGPLTKVAAGASIEHVERWSLHRNVQVSAWSDSELDRVLGPLLS